MIGYQLVLAATWLRFDLMPTVVNCFVPRPVCLLKKIRSKEITLLSQCEKTLKQKKLNAGIVLTCDTKI